MASQDGDVKEYEDVFVPAEEDEEVKGCEDAHVPAGEAEDEGEEMDVDLRTPPQPTSGPVEQTRDNNIVENGTADKDLHHLGAEGLSFRAPRRPAGAPMPDYSNLFIRSRPHATNQAVHIPSLQTPTQRPPPAAPTGDPILDNFIEQQRLAAPIFNLLPPGHYPDTGPPVPDGSGREGEGRPAPGTGTETARAASSALTREAASRLRRRRAARQAAAGTSQAAAPPSPRDSPRKGRHGRGDGGGARRRSRSPAR